MKRTYSVKVIDIKGCTCVDDYWKRVEQAEEQRCTGLTELAQLVGGKLHRVWRTGGYTGINGNTFYIATRI